MNVYRYICPKNQIKEFEFIAVGIVKSYFHCDSNVHLVCDISNSLLKVLAQHIFKDNCRRVQELDLYNVTHKIKDILKNTRENGKSFYYDVLCDETEKQLKLIVCNYVKRMNAARYIQRIWRRCVSDPNHSICKRRLMYEFENLFTFSC